MKGMICLKNLEIAKENYDKFIFKAPLAIEGYTDVNTINDENNNRVEKMYSDLKKYRNLNKKTIEDKEKLVNKILDIISLLGQDNFLIYDDGDIDYNYNKKIEGVNLNV